MPNIRPRPTRYGSVREIGVCSVLVLYAADVLQEEIEIALQAFDVVSAGCCR